MYSCTVDSAPRCSTVRAESTSFDFQFWKDRSCVCCVLSWRAFCVDKLDLSTWELNLLYERSVFPCLKLPMFIALPAWFQTNPSCYCCLDQVAGIAQPTRHNLPIPVFISHNRASIVRHTNIQLLSSELFFFSFKNQQMSSFLQVGCNLFCRAGQWPERMWLFLIFHS